MDATTEVEPIKIMNTYLYCQPHYRHDFIPAGTKPGGGSGDVGFQISHDSGKLAMVSAAMSIIR